MATIEERNSPHPALPLKTSYLEDARAAVKIKDDRQLVFEPLKIPGTPLSELIIQERHGE
jgi:hypothetical protein